MNTTPRSLSAQILQSLSSLNLLAIRLSESLRGTKAIGTGMVIFGYIGLLPVFVIRGLYDAALVKSTASFVPQKRWSAHLEIQILFLSLPMGRLDSHCIWSELTGRIPGLHDRIWRKWSLSPSPCSLFQHRSSSDVFWLSFLSTNLLVLA